MTPPPSPTDGPEFLEPPPTQPVSLLSGPPRQQPPHPYLMEEELEQQEAEQAPLAPPPQADRDLLTCGRCRLSLPLGDILLFIQHKRKQCPHPPHCLGGGARKGAEPVEVGVQVSPEEEWQEGSRAGQRPDWRGGVFPKMDAGRG